LAGKERYALVAACELLGRSRVQVKRTNGKIGNMGIKNLGKNRAIWLFYASQQCNHATRMIGAVGLMVAWAQDGASSLFML
jgi:hypothetical protein